MVRKKKRTKARVYRKCPPTHKFYDVARTLTQARMIKNSYPSDAGAIIVKTGESRGKNKDVFPYHIAVRKGRGY